MSNSERSAIVLHRIPGIGGLYTNSVSNREISSLKVLRASPFLDRARVLSMVGALAIRDQAERIAAIAATQFMIASQASL